MIVTMRFRESATAAPTDHPTGQAGSSAGGLRPHLEDLLRTLGVQPGFESGRLGRSPDDVAEWLLLTVWQSTGQLRRALSDFEVKMLLGTLAASSVDQVSVFETVGLIQDGSYEGRDSDRVQDADSQAPGRHL